MISRLVAAGLCVTALLLPGSTCVTVTNLIPGDGGGGGGSNQVTVRVINASPNLAVDVQIYATGQAVNNPDTDLFIPANQQVAGLGFAGSGVVAAGQTDEITLACDQALVVGTLGGRFLNQDTGAQVGTGTRYVLFQGSQYQCGSTIIFTYTPSGSGFRTDVSFVGPQG